MATTPQTNETLAGMAERMRPLDDFVICGHVSPDGDCLGSQLALWHALRSLGKRASCLLVRDEPVPKTLAFLPGIGQMVPAERHDGHARVFVGVDVPNRERVEGHACAILDGCDVSFTVDHHASDTTMCRYVYVDPDAASASMLVWELVKLLCGKPPLESAVCAYAGLVTDTGGFRFQNSDARAFATAAELVGCGVDPAYVSVNVFQNRSLASVRLEQLVLERMRFSCGGEVVVSWVDRADFERFGAVKSDAEPLIDAIRAIEGVRVACMLREQDGHVRGSLRSKDGTDVAAIARAFGGGGHKAAAGLTLDVPLEEAIPLMEASIGRVLADAEGWRA